LVNELALFAGAGGGLLASELLGLHTICAVEYDPYCIAVLKQRQDDGCLRPFPIWDDIRTFDGRPYRGIARIVSGGFPCQAYSSAAAGRNCADDLWPEMRRVVADVAPWYVWAENVTPRAIDAAADDLEALGYQTRALALGASDLGGDHVRDRCWLLAYAHDRGELRRALDAEVAGMQGFRAGVWQADPGEPRVAHGLAHRVDRLRATGNGQVSVVAAEALRILAFAD
jgi:DNA (cytosine-5)-methyltransferase 1